MITKQKGEPTDAEVNFHYSGPANALTVIVEAKRNGSIGAHGSTAIQVPGTGQYTAVVGLKAPEQEGLWDIEATEWWGGTRIGGLRLAGELTVAPATAAPPPAITPSIQQDIAALEAWGISFGTVDSQPVLVLPEGFNPVAVAATAGFPAAALQRLIAAGYLVQGG